MTTDVLLTPLPSSSSPSVPFLLEGGMDETVVVVAAAAVVDLVVELVDVVNLPFSNICVVVALLGNLVIATAPGNGSSFVRVGGGGCGHGGVDDEDEDVVIACAGVCSSTMSS